jgi:hypothetical protein
MESFTLEGLISPPEALDAARNRRPNYPEASRRRGEQGVVRVELLVLVEAVEAVKTTYREAAARVVLAVRVTALFTLGKEYT